MPRFNRLSVLLPILIFTFWFLCLKSSEKVEEPSLLADEAPKQNCTKNGWLGGSTAPETQDFGSEFMISFANIQKNYTWLYLPTIEETSKETDILMIVASRTDSYARRNIMRQTWMNKSNSEIVANGRMKSLFLVGLAPADYKVKKMVMQEAKLYGDIIIVDMDDTYEELIYKSLMIFLFGVSKAPQYKIIGKIDEDIMFFPDKLMALYEQGIIDSTPVSLYGLVIPAGRDIFRDKTNRWYVPESAYSCSQYPAYLSGMYYMATREAAQMLLKSTKHRDFIQVEDVLLTGILAEDLGIPIRDMPKLYKFPHDIKKNDNKDIIAWHNYKNNIPYLNFFMKGLARYRSEKGLTRTSTTSG
ncbi:Hexosyltransferase [Caenorhabditis elegans]|uniref:Hexosyltransferase n=1 Tax=Caenorhabditis elegans TaxID=6239 RepID=O62115_CAEEL|nr:Hexosyltransferase [Caenorhabditis elegans]CAA15839.1 Hexosyltransferase [Caenorhabditis elegans]|eukprot:NP_493115.1 Hexosyltransferase [Caenorhabditis elegans]